MELQVEDLSEGAKLVGILHGLQIWGRNHGLLDEDGQPIDGKPEAAELADWLNDLEEICHSFV